MLAMPAFMDSIPRKCMNGVGWGGGINSMNAMPIALDTNVCQM